VPPAGIVARASTDLFAVESPILRKALIWIRDHLGTSFGVSQLADALAVPRRTLDRLFATELSTTVGRETLRQRLVQARVMLQAQALSISEIASQTGFSSPAHLSHAFKTAFGLSPREYRLQIPSRSAAEIMASK
jgi:LacI family transcriptional regulator